MATETEPDIPRIPYWKLVRIATRSVKVVLRHENEPEVAAFTTMLPPLVDAFLDRRADISAREAATRRANKVAATDVKALQRKLRSWIELVVDDIPELDTTPLVERPGVLENLIDQAHILLRQLDVQADAAGSELAYAAKLKEELQALIEKAETSSQVAQDAMSELQAERKTLRESAVALYTKLLALRRVLRAVLGGSHRDYRKLRPTPLRRTDIDEDDELTLLEGEPANANAAETESEKSVA